MDLNLREYKLILKHTFKISRDSRDFQPSLIVMLSQDGFTGYGEATSNPYYNNTTAGMIAEIEAVRSKIIQYHFTNPEDFYEFLKTQALSSFATCALDEAANDLYGKIIGKPLYKLWNTEVTNIPITNYTIGLDTVEKMLAKMKELPWPLYKIKLGTPDDVAIVRELRKHTRASFRIDANGAWDVTTAIENARQLKNLGVEFLEQPLPATDWDGMRVLYKESVLPVIADESCIVAADVARCSGYFHGVNIKLTKCGGLTPARAMIREAKQKGLKVMVGCMTESTVGISAVAQLLPQLDYVDMDGAMLLKEDIASGVQITDGGVVVFPKTGGTGVKLY